MSEIKFKAKIGKLRRLHIPKAFYQFQSGDEIYVTLSKKEEKE